MKRVYYAVVVLALLMAALGCSTMREKSLQGGELMDVETIREAVKVESEYGTLYGTLDLPRKEGAVPVFIIIPGSGPTDRNGNSEMQKGANNSLLMLGESLTSFGCAALRYDKRGVGQSAAAKGPTEETVFRAMIEDALLWIDLMLSDPRFSSVGIIGHSEGSLVALAAAAEREVGPVISISGAGRPILEVLREQMAAQPGFVRKPALKIIGELEQGRTVEDVPKLLKSLFDPSLQPYVISWSRLDPAQICAGLEVPVLVIQGTTDLQTSQIDAKLLSESNPLCKLVLVEGMNHVLKDAPKNRLKNMLTYGKPDLPLSRGFVEEIGSFISTAVTH